MPPENFASFKLISEMTTDGRQSFLDYISSRLRAAGRQYTLICSSLELGQQKEFLNTMEYECHLALLCYTYAAVVDQCVVPPPCFRNFLRHSINGDLEPCAEPRNIMGPITDYGETDADAVLNGYMGAWWAQGEYIAYPFD
ncbi:hypothetical protein BKA70DRAFT_1430352 [Coprinopsis sp. MPI-PUGE-AT-0042]|nr:hypothetical protein BKA70DRAFT_1430352 [Coprinopsis sp. MPI-PUGE-AT-0042]